MAPGPATRSTRWRRRPEHGTWWRSDRWPGWLLRTRRLGRDRAGLPSEPGRGFCQDFPLLAELPVVASEPTKLLTISAGQTIPTAAFVSIGLARPIPDRLGRWLEPPRQLLRRVRWACLQHCGLLSSQLFRCPRKRVKFTSFLGSVSKPGILSLTLKWCILAK